MSHPSVSFRSPDYDPEDYPILMAEDNPDDVLITRRSWKKAQIQNRLYVVGDGEQALDFLFRRGEYADAPRISLMLLDINMPKVNGFEVLEVVKGDPVLRKMPVIVLTTSNRIKDVERAYELGCNSYIVKPVGYENFLQAVKDIQMYWLIHCKMPL